MKMNCLWDDILFDNTLVPENLIAFSKLVIYTQHYAFQFHTYKILYSINEIG